MFSVWGGGGGAGRISFLSPFTSPYTAPPLFLVNTFVAVKLQTTPKRRLRKCMGGKKQAAKWTKKLRALGSRIAGGDCFQCVLNPYSQGRAQCRCRRRWGSYSNNSSRLPLRVVSERRCLQQYTGMSPRFCCYSRQDLEMSCMWGVWGWVASVLRVVNEDKGVLSNYTPPPQQTGSLSSPQPGIIMMLLPTSH